jgi:hypothetical protein
MSPTPRKVSANHDDALEATIVRRLPMHYADGPDESLDRPGHVRAASSLAWIGNRVAVAQDDANFIALVDPKTGLADAVTLPAGKGDLRQFDDSRDNKKHKLDLEAMTQVPTDDGTLLLAFGSGTKKRRQSVMMLEFSGKSTRPTAGTPTLVALPDWYGALREATDFSGSDMNIEGALFVDGCIRLFSRSNGKAEGDLVPIDATCDVSWSELQAHLSDPDAHPVPSMDRITQYTIGEVNGIQLGFTDAIHGMGSDVLFLAAAEASDDARSDGLVSGSALGILPDDRRQAARWTMIRNEKGDTFDGKIEGVVLDPRDPMRALVVVDIDDFTRPAELCEVRLSGPWWS